MSSNRGKIMEEDPLPEKKKKKTKTKNKIKRPIKYIIIHYTL
jgi:hypothetical protein